LIRRAPRTAAECRDGIPNHGAYGELLMARASPRFPLAVPGIKYNLRCEAVTPCQIGTVDFHKFIEISLGIESNDKRMVDNYLVRWDLVQLRCSNFMGYTLVERLALALLELAENFGIDDPRGLLLTVSTRHKDLAELVGASRPRVTEYLIEVERKPMIVRRDRHLIIRRDQLESFLAKAHPGFYNRGERFRLNLYVIIEFITLYL